MRIAETARDSFFAFLNQAALAMVGSVASGENGNRHVEDNEIELIGRGVKSGLLSLVGNKVHVPRHTKNGLIEGKYDLFTLNREYLTQFAALSALVYDYGYSPDDCWLEYELMDVCVMRPKTSAPFIYVETKAPKRESEMDIFLKKIEGYAPSIARLLDEHDRGNDPLRKAKYIFKHKPEYLWLFTPKSRQAFKISYTAEGFSLEPIHDIPCRPGNRI